MRPLVNLAGEPFRNRRLFWLSLLIIVTLSTFLGLKAIKSLSQLEAQLAERAPSIRALEKRVAEINAAGPTSQALNIDQARAYWTANGLISRKSFSWTLLLNDIERHIPRNVRVVRVGVAKSATGENPDNPQASQHGVPLMMEVIARSVDDVTQMISAFNSTGMFIVTPKWQKPVEGLTDIEFGLELEYRPPYAAQPVTAPAQQIAEKK